MTKSHLKVQAKFPGQKEYDYFMMALDIVNEYVRKPRGHAPITEKQFAANCCMFYAAKIIQDFNELQKQERAKQEQQQAEQAVAEGAETKGVEDVPESVENNEQPEPAAESDLSGADDSGESDE